MFYLLNTLENKGKAVKPLCGKSLILFCIFTLCACHRITPPHTPYLGPVTSGLAAGATSGAIIGSVGGLSLPVAAAAGGVAGSFIGYHVGRNQSALTKLENQLTHMGVQFVRIGEKQTIIISADQIFFRNAPRLQRPFAYDVLSVVAEYIKLFKEVSIQVATFTDSSMPEERSLPLTQARAEQVANFLWSEGLDARMIVAMGGGNGDPIASNESSYGRMVNRRVEIRFTVEPRIPL